MFNQLSVKHKFGVFVFLIFVIGGLVAATVVTTLSPLGDFFDNYVDENSQRMAYVTEIQSEFGYGGAIHNFKNYVLRGKSKHAARLRKAHANILAALDGYAASADVSLADKKALAEIRSVIDAYGQNLGIVEKMVADGATPKQIDAVVKIDDTPALAGIERLKQSVNAKGALAKNGFAEKVVSGSSLVLGVLLVSLVLAVLSALVLGWSVVTPLGHLVNAVAGLARGEGDLTKRLPVRGKDEFATVSGGFNAFVEQVHGIVQQVTNASAKLADATQEMSQVSVSARDSIIGQRGELEAVVTAMNQMAASVQEVARSAEAAAESAADVERDAEEGRRVVAANVQVINSLATEVSRASDVIGRLERDSEGIGSVLDVIRGIAEQTNLLALNAAIEAARAGEQGRGFAVVADEVRTLAQRTQQSTAEIQQMIEGLQKASDEAVQVMNQGQSRVSVGVQEAERVSVSLEKMAQGIDAMRRLNTQIAVSAQQQSQVAQEIDRNLANVNHLMDDAGRGAQDVAQVSENVKAISSNMLEKISGYRA